MRTKFCPRCGSHDVSVKFLVGAGGVCQERRKCKSCEYEWQYQSEQQHADQQQSASPKNEKSQPSQQRVEQQTDEKKKSFRSHWKLWVALLLLLVNITLIIISEEIQSQSLSFMLVFSMLLEIGYLIVLFFWWIFKKLNLKNARMSQEKFTNYVCGWLRKKGFTSVRVHDTESPNGTYLRATTPTGNLMLILCKQGQTLVDVDAVQHILETRQSLDFRVSSLVVIASKRFTSVAEELAHRNGVRLVDSFISRTRREYTQNPHPAIQKKKSHVFLTISIAVLIFILSICSILLYGATDAAGWVVVSVALFFFLEPLYLVTMLIVVLIRWLHKRKSGNRRHHIKVKTDRPRMKPETKRLINNGVVLVLWFAFIIWMCLSFSWLFPLLLIVGIIFAICGKFSIFLGLLCFPLVLFWAITGDPESASDSWTQKQYTPHGDTKSKYGDTHSSYTQKQNTQRGDPYDPTGRAYKEWSQNRTSGAPFYYDGMTGVNYEKFVCYRLSQMGYKDVKMTKASDDNGADILAVTPDGHTIAIQCKRKTGHVGKHAAQEALAAKEYYYRSQAAVITNSVFTRQAKEFAKRTGVILIENFK